MHAITCAGHALGMTVDRCVTGMNPLPAISSRDHLMYAIHALIKIKGTVSKISTFIVLNMQRQLSVGEGLKVVKALGYRMKS